MSYGHMARIYVASSTPLVLTSVQTQPALVCGGLVLGAIMSKMTTKGKASSTDTKAEENAMKTCTITSPANRAVRLGMGGVDLVAAVLYAQRMSLTPPPVGLQGYGRVVLDLLAILSLCCLSTIWAGSGYNGQ
mmetsp:Transcript_5156/g.5913  ORF Transcript_5156/g.5913 Transcript_5156/m.5913 type:complete len:133 (+) Transcript_5156:34-432(+)|eukprot:CAMPEP_0205820512 /NCGR_PEP_ID=MMETSP0206-20130828/3164_1 /ASSEMBLY_ACC=CAM_ASM_000279 /TAXON_ID=36767 /ORGANISM="Euplotes focardii, Strain TN1" /LENGTH=132 /DNA_ID=CAMNT_0053115303 /DNA_START=33 /DNA_END=431 /DNA_ORIENTATION=+